MLYVLIAIAIVLVSIYKYLNNTYDYWIKRNVPFYPPVTFFGSLWNSLSMKKTLGEIYTDIYNSHKDAPYIGYFNMRQPEILVRDPEIVRDVLIKNFSSFQKNGIVIDEELDPELAKNPFFQQGNRWKTTRSQLSQCFTSGKLKLMFPLMIDVSNKMTKYIENEIQIGNIPLEAKELSEKFTCDNIATCAFGLNGKAFEDPNSEFRKAGIEIFRPSTISMIKGLISLLFPSMTKILSVKLIPQHVAGYFKNIIQSTLTYRKENNITRNDFLDIINQLKFKPGEYPYTDDDVTAHAITFFFDGFETSSSVISFTLYELAAHPDVQQKLRTEIEDVLKQHDGNFTYEAVQEMRYLNSVISETLRIFPPSFFMSKTATNDYMFPPIKKSDNPVKIEKGTPIIIPLHGLQNDPKYFSNPDEFDPERFSEGNEANIVKGTYMPFGEGPRICLGMRFAQLKLKVALVALVTNFDVSVNKRTQEPITLDPISFFPSTKGGLWLDFIKRN